MASLGPHSSTRWIVSGANFMRVVNELRQKLSANAWPVILPLGSEDRLRGQLDVINEVAYMFDEPLAPHTPW